MKQPIVAALKCTLPSILVLAGFFAPTDTQAFPKEGQLFFNTEMPNATSLNDLNFKLPPNLTSGGTFKRHGATVKKEGDFHIEIAAFIDGEGAEGLVLYTSAFNKNMSFENIPEPMKVILMTRLKRYYPEDGNRFDMNNEKLPIGSAYTTEYHSTYSVAEGETCAHIVADTGMHQFDEVDFKTVTFLEFSYCERGQAPDVRKKARAWASDIQIKN